jgi:O-methyltransferase/methyltransferase family protein
MRALTQHSGKLVESRRMPDYHAEAAATLRGIANGLRASQALFVAAQLEIADHLAKSPLNSSELAALTGTNAAALGRVMRALCALDIFSELDSGHFTLEPAGHLLRSDVVGSYRAGVLFLAGAVRWRCWSGLLETVRTGVASSERLLQAPLFDFYAAHPEESKIHDDAMRAFSASHAAALVDTIKCREGSVVVDVGGGTGELLAAILAANPTLRGVLYDLPHVVARATQVLSDNGVTDRVQVAGGSFFDSVPLNGNTYLLKTVIHDWDDARATVILRNCRSAMKPADKLLVIERELPELGQPGREAGAFLLDLEMLVMTPGGRERTRSEFAKLLSDADLKLLRTVATRSPISIFEACPA